MRNSKLLNTTERIPELQEESEPGLRRKPGRPLVYACLACFPGEGNRALLSPRTVAGSWPTFCSPKHGSLSLVLVFNEYNQGNMKSHMTALRLKTKRYVIFISISLIFKTRKKKQKHHQQQKGVVTCHSCYSPQQYESEVRNPPGEGLSAGSKLPTEIPQPVLRAAYKTENKCTAFTSSAKHTILCYYFYFLCFSLR